MKLFAHLRGGAAVTMLLVLLPPLLGLGAYLYAGEHRLLPGMTGCRYVRDTQAQIDCYSGEMSRIVADRGLDKGFAHIERLERRDPALASSCHLAAHPIGERAGAAAARADKELKPPGEAGFCREGYIHGFYIAYLEDTPLGARAAEAAASQCGRGKGPKAARNCVHAYGHVFSRKADGDMQRVARVCESVTVHDGAGERAASLNDGVRFECMYAAWMEQALIDLRKPGSAKADNCGRAPEGLAEQACYAFVPARMERLGVPNDEIVRTCNDAPGGLGRTACVRAYVEVAGPRAECDGFDDPADRQACSRAARKLSGEPREA